MRSISALLLLLLQLCLALKPGSGGSSADWQQVDTTAFFTPKLARVRGIVYYGSNERLRHKLSLLRQGQNISVAAIGGSITAGVLTNGHDQIWSSRFGEILRQARRPGYGHISMANGAVPGTFSQYMSTCVKVHVPEDADIVLLEYGVNDPWLEPTGLQQMTMDHPLRLAFERLVRKLLAYPRRPAVVLVDAFSYFLAKGNYWGTAEAQFTEFATYYQLPLVSMKACCYHLMRAGRPGWMVNSTAWREKQAGRMKPDEPNTKWLFSDDIHPTEFGHRSLAELTWELFETTFKDLDTLAISPSEARRAVRGHLRPPMLPNNYGSPSDKCILGTKLTEARVSSEGFEWINESKTPRPKWGYVGTAAGHKISFRVDTQACASSGCNASVPVEVQVAHLKSYENMGKAELSCGGDCRCNATVVDTHQEDKTSQTFLAQVMVTQAPNCLLQFAILPETRSGKHKFKIIGITISEQPGSQKAMTNAAAVDYVHDIAMRDSKGARFEVANHV